MVGVRDSFGQPSAWPVAALRMRPLSTAGCSSLAVEVRESVVTRNGTAHAGVWKPTAL